MLSRLELTEKMHIELIEHCSNRGIGFLSTGFDIIENGNIINFKGQTILKIK